MEKKYFTIEEISQKTGVPPHTLRYWESKTALIKPLRLTGGHRRYTINDLENILRIKDLVYLKGFSLKGLGKIRRQLEKDGTLSSTAAENSTQKKFRSFLKEILRELKAIEKSLQIK
ncbi:MAG: MerR family transcriptional regulator [Elusimicrobiota bacterium]